MNTFASSCPCGWEGPKREVMIETWPDFVEHRKTHSEAELDRLAALPASGNMPIAKALAQLAREVQP